MPPQFLAEWSLVASAKCVIYVTVSPRVGHVAQQIDASMQTLAQEHSNVYVLDWGTIEYRSPGYLAGDGIHPCATGQATLAALETEELVRAC